MEKEAQLTSYYIDKQAFSRMLSLVEFCVTDYTRLKHIGISPMEEFLKGDLGVCDAVDKMRVSHFCYFATLHRSMPC